MKHEETYFDLEALLRVIEGQDFEKNDRTHTHTIIVCLLASPITVPETEELMWMRLS